MRDRRGGAVLAYCRQAAGDDAAAEVAAEAFAEFRRAIQAPGSLTSSHQAETLLRGVTRRAALSHLRGETDLFAPPPPADCDASDVDIVGYLEKALAPAQHKVVAGHIAECRSCAALLMQLHDAEPAFAVANGVPLPAPVARRILTALVRAAPVGSDGGDETAVSDEAVRLLTGEEVSTAALVQPQPVALPASPPPTPPPTPPLQPGPDRLQARPAATERAQRGPRRLRMPSFGRERFGPGRSAMLLRGVVKLVVVLVAAGVVGIVLGLALAELTGDDAAPTSPAVAPTSSRARGSTTTSAAAPAATGKVRVEVLSATARPPADGAAQGARAAVRARAANVSGRAITPKPPSLLVDDLRVAVAPESSSTAAALLAPSLDMGATVKGTLRFDIPTASPSDLTAARVRMHSPASSSS